MRFLSRVLTIAGLMLSATPSAWATIADYSAVLSGSNESTPNLSPGTGFVMVAIDDVLNTMRINLTFSGLIGNTAGAHIHCCTALPFTGTAGIATTTPSFSGFPVGIKAGSYVTTLDLTLISSYNPTFVMAHGGTTTGAEAFLLEGISKGDAYFNIHTSEFPTGEIRGFLAPAKVPEPGTLALFGAALAGLAAVRRSKLA